MSDRNFDRFENRTNSLFKILEAIELLFAIKTLSLNHVLYSSRKSTILKNLPVEKMMNLNQPMKLIEPTVIHSMTHDMTIMKHEIDVFPGPKFGFRIYVRISRTPRSYSTRLSNYTNYLRFFTFHDAELSSQFILAYMVTFINCFLLCCFVLHETMTSLCKIITF